jgi:hypothetical protein
MKLATCCGLVAKTLFGGKLLLLPQLIWNNDSIARQKAEAPIKPLFAFHVSPVVASGLDANLRTYTHAG